MKYLHYPVMSEEVARFFAESGAGLIVDGTLGLGGHSERLLQSMSSLRIIGLDVDAESLEKARERLFPYSSRIVFKQLNYMKMFDEPSIPWKNVRGILVDPGISMDQLKDGERGFSHSQDGLLDMRKNRKQGVDAAAILNSLSEAELSRLFLDYGEVRKHRELAKRIIEKRLFTPLKTTHQLRELVEGVCGWRPRRGVLHPAAPVFQALRIYINGELEGFTEWIGRIPDFLPAPGRVALLSYHSIEDRMVKQGFRWLQEAGRLRIHKPFPARPSDIEILANPASRSAKLRLGEVV